MTRPTSRLSRRSFLLAAGAGGVAVAGVAGKSATTAQRKPESARTSTGYHVTDHVRKYYNTAKV